MKKWSALVAISMILLLTFQANSALAGQNTLVIYAKGTVQSPDVFAGETMRTLINGDKATVIHQGQNGIELVRMDLSPSDTCVPSQSTLCFDGVVTGTKNTDLHQVGDKIALTLDLENKKQTGLVLSGAMPGMSVLIELTKTMVRLDGPYQITLSQEGGFAGIQKTFTVDTSSGKFTSNDRTVPLDDQSIKQLTKAIKKARFFDLSEENYPPVPGSADYFSYSLQISQGVFAKTITWTDTSQNIPEKLSTILDQIQSLATIPSLDDDGLGTIQITLARNFAVTTPTFAFDGIENTLDVIDIKILESFPEQYLITVQFTSSHGGYGDRTGQIMTQALTPHTMEITIVEEEVISAVTDDTWDELNNQYVLNAP